MVKSILGIWYIWVLLIRNAWVKKECPILALVKVTSISSVEIFGNVPFSVAFLIPSNWFYIGIESQLFLNAVFIICFTEVGMSMVVGWRIVIIVRSADLWIVPWSVIVTCDGNHFNLKKYCFICIKYSHVRWIVYSKLQVTIKSKSFEIWSNFFIFYVISYPLLIKSLYEKYRKQNIAYIFVWRRKFCKYWHFYKM